MTYDELLATPVRIHKGRSVTWGIAREVADLLRQRATPEAVTLETGSGLSTLVLLHAGVRRHIAIQPGVDEFNAIREFCDEHGISTAALEAIVARSQDYLPHAALPPLDAVLIDGAHAFPHPFLDWYFTAAALKVGGILVVDDTNIATGAILADFLGMEPWWRPIVRRRRFAAFEKIAEGLDAPRDWKAQPYLAGTYPTRRVVVEPERPKSATEAIAARVLPWRLQERLRQRFAWPRPSLEN